MITTTTTTDTCPTTLQGVVEDECSLHSLILILIFRSYYVAPGDTKLRETRQEILSITTIHCNMFIATHGKKMHK